MRHFTTAFAFVLTTPSLWAADAYDHQPSAQPQWTAASFTSPPARVIPEVKANRIVVYSATWCAACQRLTPVIASLKHEGYHVEYLSVDKDADKLKYPYTAIPTIYFLSGEAVVKKAVGYRSKEQIKKTLILEPSVKTSETVSRWN